MVFLISKDFFLTFLSPKIGNFLFFSSWYSSLFSESVSISLFYALALALQIPIASIFLKKNIKVSNLCIYYKHISFTCLIQALMDALQTPPKSRFSQQYLRKVRSSQYFPVINWLDFFGQVNPLHAGCSLRMPSKEGWCYHVSKAEMPWQAAR